MKYPDNPAFHRLAVRCVALRGRGLPVRLIAEEIDLPPNEVRPLLEYAGLAANRTNPELRLAPTPMLVAELKRLKASGLKLRDIAYSYALPVSSVWRYLQDKSQHGAAPKLSGRNMVTDGTRAYSVPLQKRPPEEAEKIMREIWALRKTGLPLRDIAAKTGVSLGVVYRVVKDELRLSIHLLKTKGAKGVALAPLPSVSDQPDPRAKVSAELAAHIKTLKSSGMTFRQIGEQLGMSTSKAHSIYHSNTGTAPIRRRRPKHLHTMYITHDMSPDEARRQLEELIVKLNLS